MIVFSCEIGVKIEGEIRGGILGEFEGIFGGFGGGGRFCAVSPPAPPPHEEGMGRERSEGNRGGNPQNLGGELGGKPNSVA